MLRKLITAEAVADSLALQFAGNAANRVEMHRAANLSSQSLIALNNAIANDDTQDIWQTHCDKEIAKLEEMKRDYPHEQARLNYLINGWQRTKATLRERQIQNGSHHG